jgi:chromosome segregation ATPase
MIEPVMYFGIGFLVAALIGLVVIPLIHNRAVRLTMRRLEAATPLSMAEIQADKDQLRAEFAMSTRRLEMSVEQLKAKSTSQLAELGKKGDAINRLKIELGEKTATIFALEARDKALRDQLRATEEEVGVKTRAMHEAERTLADKQAELTKMMAGVDDRSVFADTQKVEIVALRAQVEALKDRLTAAGHDVKTVEDRREAERVALKAATRELDDERGKVENLGRRVSELEQQLATQTTEAEILGRRAQDLENRLTEQSRLLAQCEVELRHQQSRLEAAAKTEADLRSAIAELDGRASSSTERLKSEKAQLPAEIERTKDERDRLSRDLAAMKRETEEAWASERVENALLRERINDVAAEVARLASALEGPNSPIDAILAAETARDRAAAAATMPSGSVEIGAAEGSGNLADRIRALQTHASRVPHEDEPQTRN